MRKRRHRSDRMYGRRYALAMAAGSVGLSSSVFAASSTWTFTGSSSISWTSPTAWLGGYVPGLAGNAGSLNDNAIFNSNLNTQNGQPFNFSVGLAVPITLASLTMTDSNTQTPNGWTISDTGGGSITFDSGGTSPVVTIGPLGTDTYHSDSQTYVGMYAALYGTSGLAKAGPNTLRLGADNSNLSGTLNINAGALEIAAPTAVNNLAPLGNVSTQIIMGGGVLSLRSDSTMHLDGYTLNLTNNSGVNVDNTVNSTGTSSGNVGGEHTIGSIILSGAANRTLTVTGSHSASLHIGTITTSSDNLGAVINNLSPGSLTIGTFLSSATGNTTLTLGGTGTTALGFGGDITVSNAVGQGGGNLSIAYNDVHALNVGSFNGLTGGLFINGGVLRSATSAGAGGGSLTVYAAGGTLNVLAGGIPTGSLTVRVGVLNVSQTLTHTLSATTTQLTMGGGTVSSGPTSAATINLNGGTLLINSAAANIAVNTGTLANNTNFPAASTTAAIQTLAVLNGNLDLGSVPTTIRVGTTAFGTIPTTIFEIVGTISGSNTLTKTGLGQLRFRSANSLSGPIVLQGGELMAQAHTSGNALSSGPMTIMSGSLRIAQEFSGAVSSNSAATLAFAGDSLDPARIIPDAASTGTVTLNIGTFLGRVPGTTGVLTIVPQIGALNTQEVIHVGAFDPSVDPASPGFRNMMPAYVVAQLDGGNASLDYVTKDGGSNLTTVTYTGGTDITTAGSNAIYSAGSLSQNAIGAGVTASVFALKGTGGFLASYVSGAGTLQVGDGVRTTGIILNGLENITVANLNLNAPETVIWTPENGFIGSTVNFLGNLTVAGSQTLVLGGTMNLTGNRTLNVVGPGYTVLSGTLSNGNMTKSGPGTLEFTGSNAGYAGTVTISSGTLELNSAAANLSSGTVIVGANGNLEFNKPGLTASFVRPIQGTGTVVQNSAGGTLSLTAGSVLSNFANLNVAQGRVILTTADQLPPAMILTNSGTTAVFDLAGKNQTIGGLNGVGSIVSTGAAATAVLTVNGGGSFGGALRDGTAGQVLKLVKTGSSSTLSLGAISTFSGGVDISSGTLLVIGDNTSVNNSANHLGQSTVTLNGGVLSVVGSPSVNLSNNTNVPAGQTGTMVFDINNDSTHAFALFGGGTIRFSNLGSNSTVSFNGNWGAFTGTLNFDQASGTYHINTQAVNNFGSDKAFFDFGVGSFNWSNELNLTSGFGAYNMGALSGGMNARIYSEARNPSGAGPYMQYNVGSYNNGNVSTTFAGAFLDTPAPQNDPVNNVTGLSVFPTALSKVGGGSLTLTGTSNFSGPTTVTAGVLTIAGGGSLTGASSMVLNGGTFAFAGNGTIGGTGRGVTVNNGIFDVSGASGGFSLPSGVTIIGTALAGQTGYVRGNFTQNAGSLSPGGSSTAGTITFGAPSAQVTVNLHGGAQAIDILTPGSVGNSFNDLIKINGVVNTNSSMAVRLTMLNDAFLPSAGDEFPMLVYTDSHTGSLTPNITSPYHATFSLIDHPGAPNLGGTIGVKVLAFNNVAPANLTWTGAFSNDWDLNITSNFQTAGAPATFFQSDNVIMDDSAATGVVNIPGVIPRPSSLVFNNNTLDYLLTGDSLGTLQGAIGGPTSLVKNGTGTLTIQMRNVFTGGGTINGGTVIVGGEGTTFNPLEALGGINNGTGNGSTIAVSNATVSLSNLTTSNNWLVPTGSSATLLFRSIPPVVGSGSGITNGNIIGGGTVNLMVGNNIGSTNLGSADNSQATGYINLWPNPTAGGNGSISVRINSAGGGGNMVWNLPDTPTPRASLRTGISDPWTSEVPLGGLQGNGTFQGFNGGSVATKIRFVIGGRNIDGTWAGAIIDNSGTPNNPSNDNASATVIVKVGTGSLVLTGTSLHYRGETVVNDGVLVLDGIANQTGGGTLGGNLQNSPLIQVNGGTLLLRNGVQISRANRTASIGDVTMGQVWSANTGGHVDLTQALDYLSTGTGSPDRFQLPPGLTLSGNGGTYHGPVQLGYLGGGTLAAAAPANPTGAGTINAGDSGVAPIGQQPAYGGLGRYGTVTFDELHIGTGGTVTFDVSQAGVVGGAGNDLISTNGDLEVAGGTLAVNFNGGAVSGTTYRLFNAGNLLNSATFTNTILNARVAGGGPMTSASVNATTGAGGKVELVVTQDSISNNVQWQPRNTSTFNLAAASFYVANTWDTSVSNNWKNNTIGALTADFFYPTDTVTFNDVTQTVTPGGTLLDGTVVLAGPVFPAAVVVNAGSNAGYTFAGTTFIGRYTPSAGRISGTASLIKNGAGSLVLLTDNDYTGPTIINQGTLQVGTNPINGIGSGDPSPVNRPLLNESVYGTLGSGPVTIASGGNAATLVFSRINNFIVPNQISGTGALVKINFGQIRLDGSNSYTGGTFIRAGAIRMGNPDAIPANSNVTLFTTPYPVATSGSTGGTLNLFGYNLTLNALLSANSAGVIGTGTLGAVQNSGNTLITVAPTLTIASANFAGSIQNNVNLVKTSPAVATMSYNGSTYTGRTFVNQGTLQVITGVGSGTHTGNTNSTYFIASGAALAGNGTIQAPITVQPGGILAPGVFGAPTLSLQVGTLTLGTVSLNSGIINLDINGAFLDQVNIRNTNGLDTTGFSALAGVTTINISNITFGGLVTAGTYTAMNYAGVPLAQSTIDTFFRVRSTDFPNYSLVLLSNTSNTSIDLSIVHTGAVDSVWNSNANGNWTTTGNWLSDPVGNVPNSVNAVATFGPVITAARTITMDSNRTVGNVVFNNANPYTISGTVAQVLTFDRSVNVPGINVISGSHTIDAPVVSVDDMVINTEPGASLALKQTFTVSDSNTSTGHALTKTGGGTLLVEHVRNTFGTDGAATLSVNSGRLVISQKLAGNNDPSGTSNVNALSIAGGAALDVTNNSMVIDYNTGAGIGSLLGDLRTMLNDGRLTTTAPSPLAGRDVRLGYKDNSNATGAGNATVASFAGQTVNSSSVLLKFTYGGDTNLDGKVDILDLLNLANHYNSAGDWQFGDSDRNGLVNSADLAILAQDWQAGVGSGTLGGDLSGLLGSLGLPGDVGVPEPTTLGLGAIGMGSLLLSRRRRRQRS